MSDTVDVNFAQPLALFPLNEVVLLPHAVQPLHVFEPRYRQMIDLALDGTGLIAMATYRDKGAMKVDEAPVRPAACIGRIVQHDSLPDGRHNILLHGVCRARIIQTIEPEGERLFRLAVMEPIELDSHDVELPELRSRIQTLLCGGSLARLRCIETLREWVGEQNIPTPALVELLGFALVNNSELKYRLLAEPVPHRRGELVASELERIGRLVGCAEMQSQDSWPKGMSWN